MLAASEYLLFTIVAVAFALVAHPSTYLLVHKLSRKLGGPQIVTQTGVSTTTGLLAHALVAGLVVLMLLKMM